MIQHVHNAGRHHALTASKATRAAVITDPNSDDANSFHNLFASTGQTATTNAPQITGTITKPAAAVVTLTPPTFEQGATVSNPDGSVAPLNYTQFASDATAQQIAAKLGGTVTTSQMDGYSAVQRSISVPGSHNLVNAGIAAELFARYGDKPGSQAWQIINSDLGRSPMST